MFVNRRSGAAAAAVALVLTAAACGGDSGGSGSGSGGAGPVPPATGNAVSAQNTSLGMILVDGKGMTVYEFANDKAGTSTCTGSCASVWPPVAAPTPLPTSLPGVTGQIGMTDRSDGGKQLTVAGRPVYTFTGDGAPGQTNGQNKNLNGGVWTVLSGSGAPVTTNPGGASPAPAGPGY